MIGVRFGPGSDGRSVRGFPRRLRGLYLLIAALTAVPGILRAQVFHGTPSDYRSLIVGLAPGDTLSLAAGTYRSGLPIIDLHGVPGRAIVVTGPARGAPAIFPGRPCCNTVQIKDSSYVEIRDLKLDGRDIPGIDGVNGRGVTHHITIEGLTIVGHGGDQQDVGISTKGPAWDWVIRGNTIVGAGTGMYLGNSPGDDPFVRGIIEYNLMVDTIGYNLQIKQQNPRPTGIGMPPDGGRTIIRYNVFTKAHGASSGAMARPNLLVGHFPLTGAGRNDVYEIYGNFFWQNPTEALFQGEGNIALYDNVFVNDFGDAVNIQPQHGVPRMVRVFDNTVVARDSGIQVIGGAAGYTREVIGNAVFAGSPIRAAYRRDNVAVPYAAAGDFLNRISGALGGRDWFPRPGMLTGVAVDLRPFQAFTDYNRDFDGTLRDGTHRGAYAGSGVNPGWIPRLEIRPPLGVIPVPVATSGGGVPGPVKPVPGSPGSGAHLVTRMRARY
ncbi:MAG TPA: hypothetical protein ENG84_02085 [Gammaproteobacteria bacterium]|nr:hypothetical protein [Gammaproteobacteria bacterium]